MRPMRQNFSRRFLRSASTDFTNFGGTTRIIPTLILKDCSNSSVSIFPSLARYLKIAGTAQEAKSISALTPLGRTRGTFPGMPPPLPCASAQTQPFATVTAPAFDKLPEHLRLKLAHREIVEEKQRLGALHEDVVDAVIDEVAADGGVHAHGHGHFEFRAHAIGAGDQRRLFPFLVVESKERAKAADAA